MSCTDKLLEKYPFLTKIEAESLVDELSKIKKEYESGVSTRNQALKESQNSFTERVAEEAKVKANTAIKKFKAVNHIFQQGFADDFGEGLNSLLVGTTRKVQALPSVADLKTSEFKRLSNKFMREVKRSADGSLTGGNIEATLRDPQKSFEVFKEIRNRHEPDYKKTTDPDVKGAADMIIKFNNMMISRRQAVGSSIRERANYVVSQMWDSQKIAADPGFVEKMLPRIKGSTKNADSIRKLLTEMSKDAENFEFKRSGFSFGARKIEFVDDISAWQTLQEYGHGDLFTGLARGIETHSKKYALEFHFGSEPIKMVNELRNLVERVAPKKSSLKPLTEVGTTSLDKVSHSFNYLLGTGNQRGTGLGQRLYQTTQMAKTVTFLGRLGATPFAALNDISTTVVSMNTYYGTNPMEATLKSVAAWVKTLNVDADEFMDYFNVGVERYKNEPFDAMMNRYEPGMFSNAVSMFMTINGTTTLTRQNRIAVIDMASRQLKRNLLEGKNLDRLKIAGFDEIDVENLKKISKVSPNKFMDAVDIDNAPDGFFNSGSAKPETYRQQLSDKLTSFYNMFSEEAVPIAGAKEFAFARKGLRQDDMVRVISELFFTLKTTLLKTGNVFAKNFRNADPKGRLVSTDNLGHIAAYTIYAGTIALMAQKLREAITSDKEIEVTPKDIAAALAQPTGVLADFLVGQYYDYGRSTPEALAGPAAMAIFDIGAMPFMAERDEGLVKYGEDYVRQLYNWGIKNYPGQNLWYWKAFQAKILQEAALKTVPKKRTKGRRRSGANLR